MKKGKFGTTGLARLGTPQRKQENKAGAVNRKKSEGINGTEASNVPIGAYPKQNNRMKTINPRKIVKTTVKKA